LSQSRLITVSSGKGGAGKTFVSILFCRELARLGKRVALIDVDLGTPNVHIKLRQKPSKSLDSVLQQQCSLSSALVEIPADQWQPAVAPGGKFYFLKGVSGASEFLGGDPDTQDKFLLGFQGLLAQLADEVDLIVLDTGAGVEFNVIPFCMMAEDLLVVVCDDESSRSDAWELMAIVQGLKDPPQSWVIANQAKDEKMGKTISNYLVKLLKKYCRSTTALPEYLGWIPDSGESSSSAKGQSRAIDLMDTETDASRAIHQLATLLLKHHAEDVGDGYHDRVQSILNR